MNPDFIFSFIIFESFVHDKFYPLSFPNAFPPARFDAYCFTTKPIYFRILKLLKIYFGQQIVFLKLIVIDPLDSKVLIGEKELQQKY